MRRRTKVLIAAAIAALLIMAMAIPALARGPFSGSGDADGVCDEVCNGTGIGVPGYGINMVRCDDIISDLTGYTEEEIKNMRLEGQSLLEIASGAGVEEDELIEALTAEKQEQLREKLDEGKITEDQYNNMLDNMTERIKEMVNRTETGRPTWIGGFGMRGGFCNGNGLARGNMANNGVCGGGGIMKGR